VAAVTLWHRLGAKGGMLALRKVSCERWAAEGSVLASRCIGGCASSEVNVKVVQNCCGCQNTLAQWSERRTMPEAAIGVAQREKGAKRSRVSKNEKIVLLPWRLTCCTGDLDFPLW
jgi:hypothetical protein